MPFMVRLHAMLEMQTCLMTGMFFHMEKYGTFHLPLQNSCIKIWWVLLEGPIPLAWLISRLLLSRIIFQQALTVGKMAGSSTVW